MPSGGQLKNFSASRSNNVLEAKDGLDALSVARDQTTPIHWLVTDAVMHHMSGRELARRQAGLRPNTTFLFVSGYARETALDHKVVDLETNFLQKPCTLEQFSLKIRGALNQVAKSAHDLAPVSKPEPQFRS